MVIFNSYVKLPEGTSPADSSTWRGVVHVVHMVHVVPMSPRCLAELCHQSSLCIAATVKIAEQFGVVSIYRVYMDDHGCTWIIIYI